MTSRREFFAKSASAGIGLCVLPLVGFKPADDVRTVEIQDEAPVEHDEFRVVLHYPAHIPMAALSAMRDTADHVIKEWLDNPRSILLLPTGYDVEIVRLKKAANG